MSDRPGESRPPRLFVAAALPTAVVESVLRFQPTPRPGVRLTPRDQVHLTLHFLGVVDEAKTVDALSTLDVGRFEFTVDGVGHFSGNDGTLTLWAKITPTHALGELHKRTATALGAIGFTTEARPYTPHISLAHCPPDVDASYIEAFLSSGRELADSGVINAVDLFASTLVNGAPHYRLVASFSGQDGPT